MTALTSQIGFCEEADSVMNLGLQVNELEYFALQDSGQVCKRMECVVLRDIKHDPKDGGQVSTVREHSAEYVKFTN